LEIDFAEEERRQWALRIFFDVEIHALKSRIELLRFDV
jgi:hypothetical protein